MKSRCWDIAEPAMPQVESMTELAEVGDDATQTPNGHRLSSAPSLPSDAFPPVFDLDVEEKPRRWSVPMKLAPSGPGFALDQK
jgi:hypothetical protein